MPLTHSTLINNLNQVHDQIKRAASYHRRSFTEINLLAVSKTKPANMVQAALATGQIHFGENYLQEALIKIAAINHPEVVWHFIGAIQSNKTRQIAGHFDWVHTVSSIKIAKRLNTQRPIKQGRLNIFIQINIDLEPHKSGFLTTELADAITIIRTLPQLKLRGLMVIPAPRSTFTEQKFVFEKVSALQDTLQQTFQLPDFDQLSMGMSQDLEAAIATGSTWVRIGTAIFGERAINKHTQR